jgi:ribosome-binding protein aMBF1 (putative translation factor)
LSCLGTTCPKFGKAVEIGRRDHLAVPALRCLDQRQPVPVCDPPSATPAVHRRHRDAEIQRKGFQVGLHDALFANLANMSRPRTVAKPAIDQMQSTCDTLAMTTTDLTRLPTKTEMQDGFARRVRRARITAGFKTQEELGSAIDMHYSSVSNWERGLQMCHPTDMYRLALALGVTTDWLIAGDERMLTQDARRRIHARG